MKFSFYFTDSKISVTSNKNVVTFRNWSKILYCVLSIYILIVMKYEKILYGTCPFFTNIMLIDLVVLFLAVF